MEQIAELCRPSDLAEAAFALQFISPDTCREDWVRVGMSLKSEYSEAAYPVLDTWSQGSEKYNTNDCKIHLAVN